MDRVLLIDDSPALVEHVAELLHRSPGLQLVGWTGSARHSLLLLEQLEVDVVLLDITMPDMNGLEVLRRIKAASRPPGVVVLTLHDGPEYRRAALAAGSDDVIYKPDLAARLLPVVRGLLRALSLRPEGRGAHAN